MRIRWTIFFQDFFEDKLDEESVILTLVPVNEEHNEEHQMESSVSSTSGASLRMPGTNNIGMRMRIAQSAVSPALGSPGKKIFLYYSLAYKAQLKFHFSYL